MALNCSHMLSSIFVVRSVASSSGPVTGPTEYTKDCPSTGFMWQTWNVKGRPLDLCLCTMEDTNTKSVEWQRRFILPIVLTALTYWSCQHLTTVGAFSLSPVPGHLFCSAHLLHVAHVHLRSYLSAYSKSLQGGLAIGSSTFLHTQVWQCSC